MVDIDEYGEIIEEYNSLRIAESIALEDARQDLRDVLINKEYSIDYGDNYFFVVIAGYDRSGNYACISYFIYQNHIEKRKIHYLKDKRGCIIITACYDDCSPEVFLARQYRDNILSKTNYGQLVIEGYYCTVAPFLINLVKKVRIFRKLIRSSQ